MHLIRAMILTGIILSPAAYAAAQDATPPKPDAANVTDAAYANECLALTYRLPDGWKFQKIAAPSPGQSKQQMVLLRAKSVSTDPSHESLELDLLQTPLKHPVLVRLLGPRILFELAPEGLSGGSPFNSWPPALLSSVADGAAETASRASA